MNPTSPYRRSPSPLPSTSSASQPIYTAATQTASRYFWNISEDTYFPVYPAPLNVQFRAEINDLLQQLEVHVHKTMTCLSKVSSFPLTSNAEIVCTLVAFLGYNFPNTVPLSLLTNSIALSAIRPLSNPLSPEEQASASEALLVAMNGLTAIAKTLLEHMRNGIQMKTLQEMNTQPDNCQRAVMSAISRRLFHDRPLTQESSSLAEVMILCDEDESCRLGQISNDFLICMISAINPTYDEASKQLKAELLLEAVAESAQAKELLTSQACHYFLRNNLAIPTTGEGLLETCNQHCAMNFLLPSQLKNLASWNNAIFCCLARIFLQDKHTFIPAGSDARFFVTAVRPYLPKVPIRKWPSGALKCALIQALQPSLQTSEVARSSASSEAPALCLNLKIVFSRFLRSSTTLNSLLRILFKLDTTYELSPETITSFQVYIGKQIAENFAFTEDHKEALMASSAMCLEQSGNLSAKAHTTLWSNLSCATALLEKIMCQSLVLLSLTGSFPEKLTPFTLISVALSLNPEGGLFPIEIFNSPAGHQAFNTACQLFKSGRLCASFPQTREAIQASLSPMCAELMQLSLKICTDLAEEIDPIMPSDAAGSLRQIFIETAINRHISMRHAQQHCSAMFLACVNMAANRYSQNQ